MIKMIILNRLILHSRKYFTLSLLSLLITVNLANSAGLTSFPILLEPVNPRSLALGGALITDDTWAEGVLMNPAAAAQSSRSAGVSYADHLLDMWSGRITFSEIISDRFVVGGYLSTFSYGEIDITRSGIGLTGETLTASENILVCFGAGNLYNKVSYGGALKYVWGSIDDNKASAIAVDLGIIFDPNWMDLKLGVVLRNLGRQYENYGSDEGKLPTELTFGLTRKLQHLPLKISAVGIFSRSGEGNWEADMLPGEPDVSFGLGGEFEAPVNLSDRPLNLRMGYRSRGIDLSGGNQNDLLAGMSFGIGIPYKNLQFDYAFAMMGALGDIHRFGVSVIL